MSLALVGGPASAYSVLQTQDLSSERQLYSSSSNFADSVTQDPEDFSDFAEEEEPDLKSYKKLETKSTTNKKSKWLPIDFVSGLEPTLKAYVPRSQEVIDLTKKSTLRFKFPTKPLFKSADRYANVKVELFDIVDGERKFISNQTIVVSKKTKFAYADLDIGVFDNISKEIEIDIYDTESELVNTYSYEPQAESTAAQIAADVFKDYPDTAECENEGFGDCQIDYLLSKLIFESRPITTKTPGSGITKLDEGTYKIWFPVPTSTITKNVVVRNTNDINKKNKKKKNKNVSSSEVDHKLQTANNDPIQVDLTKNTSNPADGAGVFTYDPDDIKVGFSFLSPEVDAVTPGTLGDELLTIEDSGAVGIGVTSPSAFLDIRAGDGTYPSLRLNSSSLSNAFVDGAIEYDGTDFWMTVAGNTRQKIASTSDIPVQITTFSASDVTSGIFSKARMPTDTVYFNTTQTLTNKTLTSAILNTPTLNGAVFNGINISDGVVGVGSILVSDAGGNGSWAIHDQWSLNGYNGQTTDALYVTANGTVGINTTNGDETFKFHVNGDSSLYGDVQVNGRLTVVANGGLTVASGSPGTGKVLIATDNNGSVAWSTQVAIFDLVDDSSPQLGGNLDVNSYDIVSVSGGDIEFAVDTTGDFIVNTNELVVDGATDNVGIGTASPSTKLEVAGTVTSTGLDVRGNSTLNGTVTFNTPGVDSDFTMYAASNGALIFAEASNGQVGINTGSFDAAATLQVNGQIMIEGGSPALGKILESDTNGLATWIYKNSLDNSNGSIQDVVYVDVNGDVGISTLAPTAKLDVRGSVTFNDNGDDFDFRVEGTNNSDLLFIDADENMIAIDESSPNNGYLLDVNGSALINGSLTLTANADVTGNVNVTNNLTVFGTTLANGDLTVDGNITFTDNGTFTIARGTPGAGKVLISDASGGATWSTQVAIFALAGDPNPTMSNNLNTNGYTITSESNGNVEIDPDGTGNLVATVDDMVVNTKDLVVDGGTDRVGIQTATPSQTLEVNGTMSVAQSVRFKAVTTVTGNTTLDDTHHVVLVNASGDVTITLPAAAAGNTGLVYLIKKIDAEIADDVNVVVSGGGNIDGSATYSFNTQYASYKFYSDGTQWWVF